MVEAFCTKTASLVMLLLHHLTVVVLPAMYLADIMSIEMGNNERMRFMADNTAGLKLESTTLGQARTEKGLRHAAGPQLQNRKIRALEGGVRSRHETPRKDTEEA